MNAKEHIRLRHEGWFSNPTMLYFWVSILFMADDEGSFITSIHSLAASLHLSIQQVRTCLANIEGNKLITHQSTYSGTKITIYNFDSYKDVQQAYQQGFQQASNKPDNKPEKEYPITPPDCSLPDPPSLSPLIFPQEKVEEGDTAVSPKKRGKPASGPSDFFDSVLELWNSYATRSVPKIRSLSPARKEKVKLRVKEMGGWEKAKEILAECFKKISESDFCNGSTGRWAASFDWFFENEKNWLKVLEGNYDNRKEKSQLEVLTENIKKAHEYYGQQYGYGGASAYGNQAGGREDGPDEQ